MKRLVFIGILLSAISTLAVAQDVSEAARSRRLSDHVYFLASDAMNGRKAGSDDAGKAREYIIGQLEAAGVHPFFAEGWEFEFSRYGQKYCDVVGVIEGSDPVLKDEYIVLGAHYDHLGVKNGKIYNGADDNASGTAAIIEVARDLVATGGAGGRSVIIAAFDAEELGLYGSGALCSKLEGLIAAGQVRLMMSIDMVGWYSTSGYLKIEGYATIRDGRKLLEAEAVKAGINLKLKKFETSVLTATDTEDFAKAGVPTFAVTTGLKSPYHKPGDDPELIDYDGLDKVAGFLGGVAGGLSSDTELLASGKLAPKHDERIRPFQFGIKAGYGSASLDFSKGAVMSRTGFSWNAGVSAQANMESLGLRVDALYESFSSSYPVASDLFNSEASFRQTAMTVPVQILAQLKDGATTTYLGAGAFYRRCLDCKCSGTMPSAVCDSQYGWQFSFGLKLGHIEFGCDFRSGLGSIFDRSSAPGVHLDSSAFEMMYVF